MNTTMERPSMKSNAPNNVQKVSRVLLDAAPGTYTLTTDIAAAADMLERPAHVSAIVNNLANRDFVESRKARSGSNEREHCVAEVNREKFVAWLDRNTVKPPSSDPTTKSRAISKSASTHRFEAATKKPMTLSQLASAAAAGTLPPHEDDEAADAKRAAKPRPTVEEIAAWMMSTLRLYGASIVTQYKVTGMFLEAIEATQR